MVLGLGDMHSGNAWLSSATGERESCTYWNGRGAPLEVEVPRFHESAGRQQDFGWSDCKVAGTVKGLSGW